MKKAQRKALQSHRKHQKAQGLVRVEVQAPATDVAMIRDVVKELRKGSRRAGEVRSLLRRALMPEKSLLELLAIDLPDEVVESALARPVDRGRKVTL